MTKLSKDQVRTRETLLAARAFNRRTMLKGTAAAGAVALGFPMIVKDAFSSSGELNLLMWSDEFPDPVIPNFEKATGIKVNQTPFSQNEEQINKLQATGGEGFDICQPTCNRAPAVQGSSGPGAVGHQQAEEPVGAGAFDDCELQEPVDLGGRPLSPAALLGLGGDLLPHRSLQGRLDASSATARCGTRK